jgi:pilus assembly protein Flp/PilA
MRSLVKLTNQFKSDENGAALIEFTVLLAILLAAVIAIIIGGVGMLVLSEAHSVWPTNKNT